MLVVVTFIISSVVNSIICEPFPPSGIQGGQWGNIQGGNGGFGHSGNQGVPSQWASGHGPNNFGSSGGFNQAPHQRSSQWEPRQNSNFGNQGFNSWSKQSGGLNGAQGRSSPVNSWNNEQGYGYDYTIPGADVHFAAFRGPRNDDFRRSANGNNQNREFRGPNNGGARGSGWSQQNGGWDNGRGFGQEAQWGSRNNAWPQKNAEWNGNNNGHGNQWGVRNNVGAW